MIIGGDSAGGNLVLGLLSHLLHPHPSIAPIELSRPFCGVFVASPWGEFNTSADSYTRNREKHTTSGPMLKRWAASFMGDAKGDEYSQPFRASASWWAGLQSKVDAILITSGADEVMSDDIERFSHTIAVRGVIRHLSNSRHSLMILGKPSSYYNCEGNRGSSCPTVSRVRSKWCKK